MTKLCLVYLPPPHPFFCDKFLEKRTYPFALGHDIGEVENCSEEFLKIFHNFSQFFC